MNFSLVYLVGNLGYRIKEFFYHWFLGSFLFIGRHTLNFLESLDQTLALKITARNILEPLYQDHSIIGHTLGFLFRSGRVFIAGVIYFLVILGAAAMYLAWAAIPIWIVYRGFF